MNISGLAQSYDSRAVSSSASLPGAIMAPQYAPVQPYGVANVHNVAAQPKPQPQHNPFTYNAYSGANTNIVPAFASNPPNINFIQQRPLPRLSEGRDSRLQTVSFARETKPRYVQEHHHQSPPVKCESSVWPVSSPVVQSSNSTSTNEASPSKPEEAKFGTPMDVLLRVIQAKSQTESQTATSGEEKKKSSDTSNPKPGRKRYQCTINGCNQSFYQKTHLDIHERKHTGAKPYSCKEPGCDRRFSQLGNLKTHERRHSGEKPFPCPLCDKCFAQRSNVRQHMIVHQGVKPFLCRFGENGNECGKQFTQLGNLKSHCNKFHKDMIAKLTEKYASFEEGDYVPPADKELWEYFAKLYKNLNKGIKGRGKDRRVGTSSRVLGNNMRNLNIAPSRGCHGYGISGYGRRPGEMGMVRPGYEHKFEIFEGSDGSQSDYSMHSSPSSEGTYVDAHPDVFADHSRVHIQLAFGDRMAY